MSLFFRYKLALLDKQITRLLRISTWYNESKDKDVQSLSINEIDRNEQWVKKVEEFIDKVWGRKKYRKLLHAYDVTKQDLVDIFLIMTIITMPNPIFLSGSSRMSHTLVGTSMYQEIEKHLPICLNRVVRDDYTVDQEKYGNKHATQVITYAVMVKSAHGMRYGEITLEDVV